MKLRLLLLTSLLLTALPLFSQDYYFGKNKVTWRKFEWKLLKTAHFNIYYDKELQSLAEQAAKVAEEASEMLAQRYEHELTSVVPIILYNSTHEFENNSISDAPLGEGTGGFTEFERNRVVVPFDGRVEDFNHVLVHELSHAFQINILWGDNGVRGMSAMGASMPPLWVMEGLSEHLSMGTNGEVSMYERDGTLDHAMPSLMEMMNPYALGGRYFYVYRGGQSFFNWMEEAYGREKVAAFFHKLVQNPDFDAACKDVFGKEIEQVDALWRQALQRKWFPVIQSRGNPDISCERLTRHFEDGSSFNMRPVFGRDGKTIYFISNRKIYHQVLEANLDEKKVTRTVSSAEKETTVESLVIMNQALSLDHAKKLLLYTIRKGDRFILEVWDVKKRKTAKKGVLKGFNGVKDARISPDGNFAVFCGSRSGHSDLYLWDFKKNKFEALTDDALTEAEPCFSADGTKIYYSGNQHAGEGSFKRALYVMEISNRADKLFFSSGTRDSDPSISDDGKYLAFVSEYLGAADLYVRKMDDGGVYRLTAFPGGVKAPCWSPDSKKIIFSLFNTGGYDIFIADSEFSSSNTNFVKIDALSADPSAVKVQAFIINTPWQTAGSNYKPYLAMDDIFFMFGLQSSAGFAGRFMFSFSDMLKHHKLFIDTYLNYGKFYGKPLFDTDTWVEYSDVRRRLNWGVSTMALQQNVLFLVDPVTNTANLKSTNFAGYRTTHAEISGFLRYPFDKYRRADFSIGPSFVARQLREENRSRIQSNYSEYSKFGMHFRGELTLDNTLEGMLHPVDNGRSKLLAEGAIPLSAGGSTQEYFKLLLDFRRYLLVNMNASLAMRFMIGGVWGTDAEIFRYRMGGGPFHPNWGTLRGVSTGSMTGRYMHLLNIEYRSRLLDVAVFDFPFTWRIHDINGLFFLDMGSAYNLPSQYKMMTFKGRRMIFDDLEVGMGVGIRFVFLFFPIMLDFSTPWTGYSINRIKDWDTSFHIGFDF